MRILRKASCTGATTLLTALGAFALGCAGDITGPGNGMMPTATGDVNMPTGAATGGGAGPGVGNPTGTAGTTVGMPTGTGGATVTGNPGGAGGPPVVGPIPTDPSTCVVGIPASSQVPRLLNREYDNIVRDLLGVTTLSSGDVPSGTLNDDYVGAMDSFIWNAYQNTADLVAAEVIAGPNKANFIACDPATTATCYQDTITAFGRKAFRRALSAEEIASFMTLTTLTPAGTPDEIAEALLYAFLVSPSFIMVPELATVVEGAGYKLSGHEVATRLSLLLWGSIPDADLNLAADNDQLGTKELILAQAQRMLANRDMAGPQIAGAHRNYLVMDEQSHWWKVSHDPAEFPGYVETSKPTMQAELNEFFEEVAYTDGSFKELFLSNLGFVNQDTAALYGLDPAAYGPELEPVTLTDRPGFLTRVGFLSSFANDIATSPILRGAFVTVNLIGINPGAPDPDALKTPIPPGVYETRREEIEALTAAAPCSDCHAPYVNPPGFVLEGFDAVGAAQTVDRLGGEIDATATVAFTADNIKPITTPVEMMTEIANNPTSRRMYVERLVQYGTRRLPNGNDACTVEALDLKLAVDGYGILDLVADLTQADSFRLRTVGN